MVYTDDIGDLMGCYDGYDGPTNEPDFGPDLDAWWDSLDIWGMAVACEYGGIFYEDFDGEHQIFLDFTDDWWEGLTDEQKLKVYNDFFSEV